MRSTRICVPQAARSGSYFSRVPWNLSYDLAKMEMAPAGEYTVQLNVDVQRLTQKVRIEAAESP